MNLKYIFILWALLCGSVVHGQTVDFTYTTSNGLYCHPQTVHFTQNCTGNPQGFIWNFGNGQSNVHATDSAVYLNAGTYTVTLIGLYADSAIVKTKTITINPTPTVSLGVNTNNICKPGNIIFTATGSSFITSYEWTYDDGSPPETTASNVNTHFFDHYGRFTTTVRAVTAFGCSATADYTVDVKEFKTEGSITPDKGCIPMNASLSVNPEIPPGDAAQSFLWNFGDGSPAAPGTTTTIAHTYNITTVVYPSVTITTVNGCVSTFNFDSAAYGIPPINIHAEIVSGRDTFCASELIDLHAFATYADEYKWEFGDGADTRVKDENLTYRYRDTGYMRIIVTSFFHGCEGAKDTLYVYIKGVISRFDYANTCASKNTFTFISYPIGHVTHYEWSYSDAPGFIDSVNPDPTHTFPVTGAYLVQYIVKDEVSGCADTSAKFIYTARPSFRSDKPTVCKDSVITYTVYNTYNPSAGYYYVFYGAGLMFDNLGDSVLHLFPNMHGTFMDSVIVKNTNPNICSDTLRLTTPTRVAGPVTDFTAPSRVCMSTAVALNNTTHPFFPQDNIVTWSWDFWDGHGSDQQNPPAHLYTIPGTFLINLTATDVNNCSLRKEVSVEVAPIPEITVYPRRDTICQTRDTAILSAYTIDPFEWIPAVNINCNTCDTIKAYPPATTFYVAEATNIGGCKTRDTSFITVFAPFEIQVPSSEVGVCPKVPVQLGINTVGVTTWSPSATLSDSTIANPVANPDTSTLYTVIVKDSASCYADTASVRVTIYPLPNVNAGPDRIMSYGAPFTLSPAYSTGTASYMWSPPGNLSCTNCPQPTGTAEATATYTINVVSDKGCKAKDDIKIIVACANTDLRLPSAFTPGTGTLNNYFYPLGHNVKTIKSFLVYNRLGNKVFEQKNFVPNIPSLGWDGTMKGANKLDSQVFVWFLEAVCEGGETINLKGTVLLLR